MVNHGSLEKQQIKLYTIGFAQKTAKEFFTVLKNNRVRKLIDIRLNNTSQLAGFAKKQDLEYFLNEICNIKYLHEPDFAPAKEMLDSYKKKEISWSVYEERYLDLLSQRCIAQKIAPKELDMSCFLCSEPKSKFCHRRLLAEYLKSIYENIEIKHL